VILKRLFGWLQRRADEARARSTLADPTNWEADLGWHNGRVAFGGQTISPDAAMGVPAVYAAVKLLAEAVAGLPLHTYRRLPNGARELAPTHPVYPLLHNSPNPVQTAYVAREYWASSVLLEGPKPGPAVSTTQYTWMTGRISGGRLRTLSTFQGWRCLRGSTRH
jgi:phage portal protein BeeE